MLTFEHPWMIAGTAAAAVPLAIHLLDRRRPRPVAFSAIDFVLRSQRQNRQRLRLRRLLVFLARTLLLLAIPLALAGPRLEEPGAAASSHHSAAAVALVLDGSLSMSYQWRGTTLFEQAQKLALGALRDLNPEDSVTFELCGASTPSPEVPGFDRASVERTIEDARVGFAAVDLQSCLQKAATTLGDSPLRGKRLVVASDLAASNLRADGPRLTVPTASGAIAPEVVLLDPRQGDDDLPNQAISSLRIEPDSALGSRGFAFTFTVQNFGAAPASDLAASLRIDDRVVARGSVSVPGHGSAEKSLGFRFPEGGTFRGDLELGPDALPGDDRKYFVARIPKDLRVLVVAGAGSASRSEDQAFFADAALAAPGSPVQATRVDADAFNQVALAPGLDAVVLLDVREVDPPRVQELTSFVEKGGGLVISLGPQVDADQYRALGDLMPRALRVVKTAAEPGTPDAEKRAAHFSEVDWAHPIFDIFAGDARDSLLAASTYRYFLLEPGAPGDLQVLASFNDGAPALVSYARGRGRILLYLSTLDRRWSDWPIRPSFLPAMQRMVGYVAASLDDREVSEGVVGVPQTLALPTVAGIQLKGPDGRPRTLTPVTSASEASVTFVPDLPGIYHLDAPGAAPLALTDLAVNVDPRESDMRQVPPPALATYLGRDEEKGSDPRSATSKNMPLWTSLLLAAGFFLMGEGALLMGGRRAAPKVGVP